jgi:hypothetical protein
MAHIDFSPAPTVQPREAPPSDYQTIQTNPREFGAQIGAGAERLGEGLSKAGQFFGEVAADDATNKFMTAANTALYGDPTKTVTGPDGTPQQDLGYFGTRGRSALDQRAAALQQIDQIRTQLRGGLGTPEEQLQFDQYTRRFQYYMGTEVSRHADEQAQQWYGEVEKASSDVAKSNIVNSVSRGDDIGLQHATSDLVGSYVKQAQRLGGGADLISDAMLRGRRDAAVTEIMARAPTDANGAQAALERNRGVLSAEQYEELANRLKVPAADQAAQSYVNGIAPPPAVRVPNAPPGRPLAEVVSSGQIGPLVDGIIHNEGGSPRGVTNNPGNIKFTGAPEQADSGVRATDGGTFASYPTPAAGRSAIDSLIVHAAQGQSPAYGPAPTVGSFISTYTGHGSTGGGPGGGAPGLSAALDRIEHSDLSPEAKTKAAELTRMNYTASWTDQTRQYEEHERAQKQASDDAENSIIQDAASDKPTITAQQIANNTALTPDAKLRMMGVIRGKAANPNEQALAAYGPGFWSLYQRVTAGPGGQLPPLTDQSEIMRHAGPGGDLTLAGAQELTKTMAQVRRPEQAGDTKMQAGALAYAKHQLSFEADYGTFKIRDPKGEDAFNIGFTPAFFKYWQDGIAAGKTPADLVAKDQIDRLVTPFKRTPAELMKDQLGAGEEVTGNAAAPSDLGKMNPQQLVAAVRANPALRAQAEGIALRNGWIQANPAPPIVAPATTPP